MNDKDTGAIARDFLTQCAGGQPREAFRKHAAPSFRHHNAWFGGDAETLLLAMEADARENPGKSFDIKHTLVDGDLVAVHSHIRQKRADPGHAVVHLLRFEGLKIAEFWDVVQAVPADGVNENGMF